MSQPPSPATVSPAATLPADGVYRPRHAVRIVTAASLFDGHDAAINIMRRILQASGAEVIHLGHNRSVQDIVDAAIQEDAQGIAVSSYQGGHMEFFRYMVDLLRARGGGHIKVFGGGGGTIIPEEKRELEAYGVARIFHPEDGRRMGLQGMINDILMDCDYDPRDVPWVDAQGQPVLAPSAIPDRDDWRGLARAITASELDAQGEGSVDGRQNGHSAASGHHGTGNGKLTLPASVVTGVGAAVERVIPVIGITGPGGAGKSSFTDEVVRRFTEDFPDARVAVLSVDPTKRRTGGALLGDRIRFNSLSGGHVYMRSFATRGSGSEVSQALDDAIRLCKAAGFDLVIAETSGIGQGDASIVPLVDVPVYVMTPEYGAPTQLEKIEMLDLAEIVVINKYDKPGAADALRDVQKAYQRAHGRFKEPTSAMPVYPTLASLFNDRGCNTAYIALLDAIARRGAPNTRGRFTDQLATGLPQRDEIIPARRVRYLSEIADTVRAYKAWAHAEAELAAQAWALAKAVAHFAPQAVEAAVLDWDGGASSVGTGDRSSTRAASPAAGARDESVNDAPSRTVTGVAGLPVEASGKARFGQASFVVPTPFGADAIASAALHLQPLMEEYNVLLERLDRRSRALLAEWPDVVRRYRSAVNRYDVRGKTIEVPNFTESLSGSQVPRVALPRHAAWGNLLEWRLLENLPGQFPFTAGVFPFKRQGEDPTRMFAGEGGPWRTNKRFHYLSRHAPAKRLSTAFDSVTLYGEDPGRRPDIWGKVGNSGVSIATVEDMEALYAGFDLTSPQTSVSMTINGPAPTILAFYFNTAVRQSLRRHLKVTGKIEISDEDCLQPGGGGYSFDQLRSLVTDDEYQEVAGDTVRKVRGTVQADILKEDQGQNTCIFSTEFSLRAMGDVQAWFTEHGVKNFYSVSISGYHIAEAGANPISQLAFTLSNGFTFVEYYRARGMAVDGFAPNLSFFFSNGMDPEYSVIGRVARRIWATAMRELYGAGPRSQQLKYHVQTSGRSLHAQEIAFNDIRTTLQALLAIYDNCNSLHTNAYDEAITTPTEESVRRALAIQLIINHEFGVAKNENPNQGAFIIEELTQLVEEAVLSEFDRLTERGGVLGAMERMYQRSKIQEESLYYEHLKHSGELPLVGVNTFLNEDHPERTGEAPVLQLIRASEDEKEDQLARLLDFQARHADRAEAAAIRLKEVAISGGNLFGELLRAHDLVDPVDELRLEELERVHRQVRRHDQHRVGEVDRAALPVGQPTVVEHLQQHVEDVGVRLLDLVEQHDGVGPPADGLGQLPALVVADVPRRGADEPGDGVLLLVLAHVDADHGPLVVEEELGQRLGQLGLADAGGPEEEEAADRPVGVGQAGPGAADGAGHRGHGLLLPDDALVEHVLHADELLHLALHEARDGDAGRTWPRPRPRPPRRPLPSASSGRSAARRAGPTPRPLSVPARGSGRSGSRRPVTGRPPARSGRPRSWPPRAPPCGPGSS